MICIYMINYKSRAEDHQCLRENGTFDFGNLRLALSYAYVLKIADMACKSASFAECHS